MPAALPPATLPFVELAQEACAVCPENLASTCMTDVGFTGDASLAAACTQAPGEPVAENTAQTLPYPVYPLPGATWDCVRNEMIFRAPGAANLHIQPDQVPYYISLGHDVNQSLWAGLEYIDTSAPPPGGWGEKFQCTEVGPGWGECRLKLDPENSPCIPRITNHYRFLVHSDQYGWNSRIDHDFWSDPQ